MSDREKVINSIKYCINHPLCIDCDACDYGGESSVICDRLIQDTLALLEEQPQWVSVKDRLPKATSKYLVYVGMNCCGLGMYPEYRTATWNTISKVWYVDYDQRPFMGELCGEVTHWMPLPEPPKEVSE